MTLTPAYGRDYKTKALVEKDFHDNKDFVLQPSGQYINKEQVPKGQWVQLRYGRLRKVVAVKV